MRKKKLPFHRISAVRGDGLDELLEAVWREIAAVRASEAEAPVAEPTAGEPDLISRVVRTRRDA